ncbi:SufB/SufD family protein [Intestinicryptomonas porci]|uniref:SufD family Fe-S cluster assembly protein n=1 Tax=Intestinicryptomonas porci TaxID=2926320 RepID=A0ABU4WG81_9BACT|nr:SufD family Fe-S cluster assembly protein [Opitutales bacterium CLA-KB-P66]
MTKEKPVFSRFNSLPFPGKKDEHWRFSNLAFWGGEVEKFMDFSGADFSEAPSGSRGVFENPTAEKFLKILLGGGKFDAYCARNFSCAKIFSISKNAKVKITNADFSDVNIFEIEEGAQVDVFDESFFECGKLSTRANFYFLKKGAKINVNTFYNSKENSPRYTRADFYLQDGAQANDVFVEAGKSNTRVERNFELAGKNSRADISALFVSSGSITHDLRTRQHHTCPEAFSNLKVKNILSGLSRTAFGGLIRVEENAQKTESYQSCRSLLVSEKARASGMPVLEILANDVMCSHGCAAFQPDREELFYMKSRGLCESMAQKLLVDGFANEIIGRFSDEVFASAVSEKISAM